jgi:ankyrin repeat protein
MTFFWNQIAHYVAPLSWVIRGGHLAIVERLLQDKAEVIAAATKESGRTALQAAKINGHLAIVRCLRDAGAVYEYE